MQHAMYLDDFLLLGFLGSDQECKTAMGYQLAKFPELGLLVASCHSCSRQELKSLVVSLNYASLTVKPGKTFMRCLFELLSLARRSQHRLRINTACQSDQFWWHSFLAPLNRASVLPSRKSQFEVLTNASGSFGCGAIWVPCWFQVEWTGTNTAHHKQLEADGITFKEVLRIVWTLAVWGLIWFNSGVLRQPKSSSHGQC